MKKFSAFILSSAVMLASIGAVSAEGNPSTIKVYIDGQLQTYDQSPVIDHDFTLVPLRSIFEALGANVDWDGQNKKITATKDKTTIFMTIRSEMAFKNGMPVKLDASPKIINGRTMVPLRFVSESLGSDVKWDGANKRIDINKKSISDNSLTYEAAISLALKNSFALKQAKADIDRSKEVRDSAGDNLHFIPIGNGNGESDAIDRGTLLGVRQADIAKQSAEKNLGVANDKVSYNVKKAYDEILQKTQEKQLSELSLSNAITQEHLTESRANVGLASEIDKQKAQSSVQESREKLAAVEKALDDANQKFNQLLGLDIQKKYELIDSPVFEKLEEVNLDDHIRKVLNDNPSLWALEKQVDLAELNVKLYAFNANNATPYEAKEIDITKAKYTLAETKQKLDEGVRTMYYNIKQLESQLGLLQASLSKAEQNLKLVQAKFDAGMAIQSELTEASLNIEQLRKQIFDVTVQHEQLKIAFEKPWVLTGN